MYMRNAESKMVQLGEIVLVDSTSWWFLMTWEGGSTLLAFYLNVQLLDPCVLTPQRATGGVGLGKMG